MCAFLHPSLAQTGDYSRSNSTCTRFLRYGTPIHTWNKRSLDVKLNMKQVGMGVIDGALKSSLVNIIWWVNA